MMYRLSVCPLLLVVLWTNEIIAKDLSEIEALSSKPTRCTYQRAYDMYGAHCAGLGLTKIPPLRGGIEILDFTDNKLRELHGEMFSSFSSVKFLYLADNRIYSINDDTFIYLTYLQTLDLSNNVIQTLPNAIFQLSSLRTLYLGGNPLGNMDIAYKEISIPIKAPLEQLDLSDCKIRELPDLGLMPQMLTYNISDNPLTTLPISHFSQMCNLKKLDISASIDLIRVCDLKRTITWFDQTHLSFTLDDYAKLNSKEFQNCMKEDFPQHLNETFYKCKSEYLPMKESKTSRRTWLTIAGGLAGFLVGFILLLYVMHLRTVRQTKRALKKAPVEEAKEERHATAILLNNAA